jgi:hypothetical protein
LYKRMFEVAPSNLCQKLIKIDILLSHVKLKKLRMVTRTSVKAKTLSKSTCKKIGFESKNRPELEKTEIRSFF